MYGAGIRTNVAYDAAILTGVVLRGGEGVGS